MDRPTVLFVSHPEEACGVHQFGRNVSAVLSGSQRYDFAFREISTEKQLAELIQKEAPAAVIYNYHPSSMSWIKPRFTSQQHGPQVGILHEVTQGVADTIDNSLFDYYIAPDPTLVLRNPIVFKTGRLVPQAKPGNRLLPQTPTIGSFGFGTRGKGFLRVVRQVVEEYDHAIIRLHIPFSAFADATGDEAHAIADQCRAVISKPGIELLVTHDFLSQEALVGFLQSNTVNAFFYENLQNRGLSSVIDFALAAERPIAVTRSSMFRHLFAVSPSIFIEDRPLRQIVDDGFAPLRQLRDEWSDINLCWDYERIIARILSTSIPPRPSAGMAGKVARRLKRIRRLRHDSFKGVSRTDDKMMGLELADRPRGLITSAHEPSDAPQLVKDPHFNRILDDSARDLYAATISTMVSLLPELMARKIPRANVQQAFVLDSVLRLIAEKRDPRVLGVGTYEDTAADSLLALGYKIEGIDPALNYDLSTYLTKPSTKPGSCDIIFATSVLEHVQDDERFVADIAVLLKPGGVAVLTCDYNDSFRPGDAIPAEDFRFYTQRDLRERLLRAANGCELVDEPQWDCDAPDFSYAGCKYTFATFVFRKRSR